jgi:DNA-directed RNA polymerase subunit RPC12/RpoP
MSDAASIDPPNAQSRAHRCPQCRGELRYDAAAQLLRCEHCGHSRPVASPARPAAIIEYDLEHGLAQASSRGYGTPTRVSKCGECGASVHFGEKITAMHCAFCGSPQVLERQATRQVIQPESLIPFQIVKSDAANLFSKWLKGLWFRPSSLKSDARIAEMTGVYVPYWTFDADVASQWTAEAGYYYEETETYTERDASGQDVTKQRQVRKTRWEPASGSRSDQYDELLVCASAGLPSDLANGLRSFTTEALKPYDPQYLVGWNAEEYAVELNDAWKTAVKQIEKTQHSRCGGDVPGDTHQGLEVENRISNERFKHVLLPIWISAYRYDKKIYRFLVNGQTGELSGQAPYSVIKILLFVLFIAALIAAFILVFKDKL